MCCKGHEGAPSWPRGFKRIRHYGLLAPKAKTERPALARRLLEMPAANPQAREDAQAFMRRVAAIEIDRCPHCATGRLRVLELLAADRAGLAAIRSRPLAGGRRDRPHLPKIALKACLRKQVGAGARRQRRRACATACGRCRGVLPAA